MLLDVRRCLLLGLSTALLCGPAALTGAGSPVGYGLVQAQETSPEAAEDTGRKRRRTRSSKGGKAVTAPGMQQATPVAIFGDWNVFASGQGKARVCYAIAQPTTRTPKTLARDTAYLFVTVRKGENIANEVAVMLGFPAKPAASQAANAKVTAAPTDPAIHLGAARYGLVIKENNAWLQNQAEETRVVTEMARTAKLQIKTTSMRGNPTNDEYALAGFGEAIKRAREECK